MCSTQHLTQRWESVLANQHQQDHLGLCFTGDKEFKLALSYFQQKGLVILGEREPQTFMEALLWTVQAHWVWDRTLYLVSKSLKAWSLASRLLSC